MPVKLNFFISQHFENTYLNWKFCSCCQSVNFHL